MLIKVPFSRPKCVRAVYDAAFLGLWADAAGIGNAILPSACMLHPTHHRDPPKPSASVRVETLNPFQLGGWPTKPNNPTGLGWWFTGFAREQCGSPPLLAMSSGLGVGV